MKDIVKKLARDFGVKTSLMSISRLWKKWMTQKTVRDLPRKGRPRKTTLRDDRIIRRAAQGQRSATTRKLLGELGTTISRWTLKRRLKEFGIVQRPRRRIPLISTANQKKRVAWCRQHYWTVAAWQNVIWSDESRFAVKSDRPGMVWVAKKEKAWKVLECCDPSTQYVANIHVWGYIMGDGRRGIRLLDSTVCYRTYVEILKESVMKEVFNRRSSKDRLAAKRTLIFQQGTLFSFSFLSFFHFR